MEVNSEVVSSSENNELPTYKCHYCETHLFFITAGGLRQHYKSNHGTDQLDGTGTNDSNDIGADDASSSSASTNDENENSRELSTLKRTGRARTRVQRAQPARKTRKTTNGMLAPIPNNEQPLMVNHDPDHHASLSSPSPSVSKNPRSPMISKHYSRMTGIRMKIRKPEIAPEIYWPTYDPSLVPRSATPEPDEDNINCHFETLTSGANTTVSFRSNSKGETIGNSVCFVCGTEFEDKNDLINHLYQFHPHPPQSAWADKGNPNGNGISNGLNVHDCSSGNCVHVSDDYIFITVNENMG